MTSGPIPAGSPQVRAKGKDGVALITCRLDEAALATFEEAQEAGTGRRESKLSLAGGLFRFLFQIAATEKNSAIAPLKIRNLPLLESPTA